MEESEASQQSPSADSANLSLLEDVSVEVSLRVGTCSMTMGEVLQLESGDVVQMNESIDDPVLLYLNDKAVAIGEVVLVEDRLGLKIKEILEE
jgi:flagellar motor switch protein FliN/FliY|tara:strand:- start:230 stop:508 length:279 start_codon:yes stop_codon:yes gene_type:complete